jgi:adenine-specific DNA-methyltransferase
MDNIDNELLAFNKSDIFTPDDISKKMSSYMSNDGNLLEPAVGHGNLLKYIDLKKYTSVDIYDIKNEYLEKCPTAENIHKYHNDFIKEDIHTKYKNIIINPPFIRIQDLPKDYVKYIKKKWMLLEKGNIDYYYVFLLKCISLLSNDGIMVAIIPNSYLYNKSAIGLRKYFIDNKYVAEIIDFGCEKVFPGISTYCCITVFSIKPKKHILYNDEKIEYASITNENYSFFANNIVVDKKLGDICKIKNGIATLRDKIYIHKKKLYDEHCWQIITNGKEDLYIIYPYNDSGKIIDEDVFRIANPQTYKYLETYKEELKKRDKGNKKYPTWYAYGRTQSIIKPKTEKVIFISTFCDPKNMKYNISLSKLFYSCICIEPDNINDIEKIINILKKNEKYIEKNSSKRGGGWISISGVLLKSLSCI